MNMNEHNEHEYKLFIIYYNIMIMDEHEQGINEHEHLSLL